MPRKKVRFVVNVDGQYKQLFAVGEGSNGDLSILLNPADDRFPDGYMPEPGELSALLESRISVHRSLNSVHSGTTISETYVMDGPRVERRAAFVKNSKKDLLWLVYSQICANLQSANSSIENKKGEVFVVALNPPLHTSLVYHVFVASKHRTPPVLNLFTTFGKKFKHFQIFVYVCYVNVPVTHCGVSNTMPTSATKVNEVQDPERNARFAKAYPDGAISLTNADVAPLLRTINNVMLNQLMELIRVQLAEEDPEWFATLENTKRWFTRHPIAAGQRMLQEAAPQALWSPPIQG